MITNQKIEAGDVEYSRLSEVLRFTVAANIEAIRMMEDICGRTDMSIEELAHEMAQLLQQAITTNYHRGGHRRKYD